MVNSNEISTGSVVYCYSFDHPFIKDSKCPAIAISSFVHGAAAMGKIGFECTNETLKTRRNMIGRRFAFEGSDFRYIADMAEVYFAPQKESINFTIKAITQMKDQLCKAVETFSLDQAFLSKSVELLAGKGPLHKDSNLADKLGLLNVEYGYELQFWPFLTPYESVCYLYGQDRDMLLDQVQTYFTNLGVKHKYLDERYFPIF